MSTGKKIKTGGSAMSERIQKLTTELKIARKNLQDTTKKVAEEATIWKNKLAAQNASWGAKLKKIEMTAFQKCAAACAKKEETKKKALLKAMSMAETKFEKEYVKKRPAKKTQVAKVAVKKPVAKKRVSKPKK